jgi:hypothetical protein
VAEHYDMIKILGGPIFDLSRAGAGCYQIVTNALRGLFGCFITINTSLVNCFITAQQIAQKRKPRLPGPGLLAIGN